MCTLLNSAPAVEIDCVRPVQVLDFPHTCLKSGV